VAAPGAHEDDGRVAVNVDVLEHGGALGEAVGGAVAGGGERRERGAGVSLQGRDGGGGDAHERRC
jgi:hypothetical protein